MAAADTSPILPGRTLGILGGGQLGAMFAMAARRMGYRVEAISDIADCPAARHCDRLHVGDYGDPAFLARAAAGLDVATFEFENIPAEAGRSLAAAVPVRPAADVLFTTQDRAREKAFLTQHGFACAPYRVVHSREDLHAAVADLGLPAVLKTAAFGYDGKGQMRLTRPEDVDTAWATLGAGPDGPRELVLEGWIDFDCEISVVAARGLDGEIAAFAPTRNAHAHHILDVSSVPAELPQPVLSAATLVAGNILTALGVVGVACVEFFVTKDGAVLVNEIAPRTHNSGHLTIEACDTSQFEQQVRAVCGLPLGSTRQRRPAAMANLLGDVWANGEPDWAAALGVPGVSLHLYGKSEPRPGRKMGHLTALADTGDEAIRRVTRARDLTRRG
ncbi:MAG: 5-(carboxyamino)imidazole ribonucleotide synthase [Planctomycetia bacterium]|nr:5-(carboxyamino)imidazole ribonucleotide synthase [Planctomycetia bacterium]